MSFQPILETTIPFTCKDQKQYVTFYRFDDDDDLYVSAYGIVSAIFSKKTATAAIDNIPRSEYNSEYGRRDVCSVATVMTHIQNSFMFIGEAGTLIEFMRHQWPGIVETARTALGLKTASTTNPNKKRKTAERSTAATDAESKEETTTNPNKKHKTAERPTAATDAESKEETKEQPKVQRILLVLGSEDVTSMKWGIVTSEQFPYTDDEIKELCKDAFQRTEEQDERVDNLIDQWCEKLPPMVEATCLGGVDRIVHLVPMLP
jgi:hypothetical protein